MKERPILFSAPMVRAILDGSKTQTRRIMKVQPTEGLEPPFQMTDNGFWNPAFDGTWIIETPDAEWRGLCPYGKSGDHLWVREAHYVERAASAGETGFILYRASDPEASVSKWRPSIHMPRWASRITLEVVDVRVERLNEISRGDAMAEGCPFPNIAKETDPAGWFRDLWESINGPGSWEANPWVWVVEFKKIEN